MMREVPRALDLLVVATLVAGLFVVAGCGGRPSDAVDVENDSVAADSGEITDVAGDIAEPDDARPLDIDASDSVEDFGIDIVADIGTDIVADIGTDIVADIGTDIVADLGTDIAEDLGVDLVEDFGIDIVADLGTDTSDVFCGSCDGGKICVEGECQCPGLQKDCEGACITPGTNENCSGCGDVCTGGKECRDGGCECPVGEESCSGVCTLFGTALNCSGCGDVCEVWQSCDNGSCEAVSGEMVLVPAGSFWMGCNDDVDTQCYSDEKPYHEVTLSGYYIDITEVTQGAYKTCVDAGLCDTPSCDWDPSGTPHRPVDCVNWTQAVEFCVWAGKRLPTEAEWEKAARGTDGRKYPWGNEDATCDFAVMDEGGGGCGTGNTWDVCGKSPAGDSPYGLCDMSGNVWEWVSDWYGSGYYSASPATNPTGPVSGSYRVERGGGFGTYDYALRASNRVDDNPSFGVYSLGFRCAMSQ